MCASSTLSRSQLSATLALLAESRSLRDGLLPLIYRLNRCAPSDVNAIGYASGSLNQLLLDSPVSQRESPVLKMQIALSEMWEDPRPAPAELIARCDSAYACPGFGPVAAVVDPIWPRYTEPLANMWPSTHIPILAMHGELDTRAPIELARSFSDSLHDPGQVFVAVPYSTHSVILNSPRASISGDTCGADLLQGFVISGGRTLDMSCLNDLVPPRFDPNPTLAGQLFNRNDVWEDE